MFPEGGCFPEGVEDGVMATVPERPQQLEGGREEGGNPFLYGSR